MTEPKFKYAFFIPYIGEHYEKGINGKKVFVLGASFYCSLNDARKVNCTKRSECTSYEERLTYKFDKICPQYKGKDSILSEEPDNEVTSCPDNKTYRTFDRFLKGFLKKDIVGKAWDYVSFTNYIQFMQPNWKTLSCYLTEQDYLAFIEVVQYYEYDPDVIIVWGELVEKELKRRLPDSCKSIEKIRNRDKVLKVRFNNEDRERVIVFITHPICSFLEKEKWDENLDEMTENIKLALQ